MRERLKNREKIWRTGKSKDIAKSMAIFGNMEIMENALTDAVGIRTQDINYHPANCPQAPWISDPRPFLIVAFILFLRR